MQVLCRLGLSAIAGGCVLFLGKSLGAAVGVNAATLAVSALLGMPGVAGMFVLSFLL
ncbi:pro-sigmaK processing inhibitor BofA family protein [Anaerotignum sp.]